MPLFQKVCILSCHSFVIYNCFGIDPQADFDARHVTFTQFNLPLIDKQTGGYCVLNTVSSFLSKHEELSEVVKMHWCVSGQICTRMYSVSQGASKGYLG